MGLCGRLRGRRGVIVLSLMAAYTLFSITLMVLSPDCASPRGCQGLSSLLGIHTQSPSLTIATSDSISLNMAPPADDGVRPIYIITPTYFYPAQLPHLTRLANTLRGVPNIVWIVIEDSDTPSAAVDGVLARAGLTATIHLATRPPATSLHRGVVQRNHAMDKVIELIDEHGHGTVYFADDDNTYDSRIFPAIRSIDRVAVWPVGLISRLLFEGPICDNGHVTGWRYAWGRARKFPLDMAGFAVPTRLLLATHARFLPSSSRGHLETEFLEQLVSSNAEFIPLAEDCTEIWSWHTQSKTLEIRAMADTGEAEAEAWREVQGVVHPMTAEEYRALTGSSNKALGIKEPKRGWFGRR